MKKTFKVLKIAIIVLLVIYILSVLFKFLVLKKIYNETRMNISKENYKMTIELDNKGTVTKTQCYYMDGRSKNIASNGVYTWTNQKYRFKIDEANKIICEINTEDMADMMSVATNSTVATFIPGYFKTTGEKAKLILSPTTWIWYEKVDGTSCYKIKIKEQKSKKIFWIGKDSFTPKKAVMDIDGYSLLYKFDISFLSTTVKDTDFIDITEYTFVDTDGSKKPATEIFK